MPSRAAFCCLLLLTAGCSDPQKPTAAAKIRDLVALMRRSRVTLAKSSARDDYEWALRQAVNADQDLSLMRLLTPGFFEGFDKGLGALPHDPRQSLSIST